MTRARLEGLALVSMLLAAAPSTAQSGPGASQPTFRLGLSAPTIADVGSEEVLAVTRALTRRLAPMSAGVKEPETLMFKDFSELRQRLSAAELDVIIVTGLEYARLGAAAPVEPAFLPKTRAGDSFRVVLLVRRKSGIVGLADLRGHSLMTSKDYSLEAQNVWIGTKVMQQGFAETRSFFSRVGAARNPSQAILSVFFAQEDACLATDAAFAVASELNPQIGAELVVLAQSPPLPSVVVGFRTGYAKDTRDRVSEAILHLHEDPEGQQLLRMFRTERLVAVRPELLESSRSLISDHEEQRAARRRSTGESRPRS